MKRIWILAVCSLFLLGCGAEPAAETLSDTLEEPVMAPPREIGVELPGEAAIPTMEGQGRRYYLCDDYEITLDRRPSGDIKATVEDLTGYDMDQLTVVKTRQPGAKRYDFVWASSGEEGEVLGRAAVLDDGNYHYTMTVLRDPGNTEQLQVVWRQVFDSFHLV